MSGAALKTEVLKTEGQMRVVCEEESKGEVRSAQRKRHLMGCVDLDIPLGRHFLPKGFGVCFHCCRESEQTGSAKEYRELKQLGEGQCKLTVLAVKGQSKSASSRCRNNRTAYVAQYMAVEGVTVTPLPLDSWMKLWAPLGDGFSLKKATAALASSMQANTFTSNIWRVNSSVDPSASTRAARGESLSSLTKRTERRARLTRVPSIADDGVAVTEHFLHSRESVDNVALFGGVERENEETVWAEVLLEVVEDGGLAQRSYGDITRS